VEKARDYLERLAWFGDENLGEPFLWGSTDCAALAVRAISLVYDDEGILEFVDWHDEESARAFFGQHKPDDWLATFGAARVESIVPVGGFIVTASADGVEWPGVYIGVGSRLLTSREGGAVKLTDWTVINRLPVQATVWRLP
jgi:hypothetical protein